MNKGPAVCKAADLSPYQEGLASDCQLFNENAYEHMSSQLPNIRSASSGYTSFHLFVSVYKNSLEGGGGGGWGLNLETDIHPMWDCTSTVVIFRKQHFPRIKNTPSVFPHSAPF